jgi:hypothetical protein
MEKDNLEGLQDVVKSVKTVKGKCGRILKAYPHYVIFSDGTIYSQLVKRLLGPRKDTRGYMCVTVKNEKGTFTRTVVHKLVALAYIPNPEGAPFVNHKDLNKTNNISENLEWVTSSQNFIHALENGAIKLNGRPVLQYSLSGVFIERFDNINDATRSVGGKYHNNIRQSCDKDTRTAYGFKWKYEEEKLREERSCQNGEVWKKHPHYPKYWVSDHARVYSKKSKKYLRIKKSETDYHVTNLNGKSIRLHILVAETFIGFAPPEMVRPEVNHKDGDKYNNHLSNLEWLSHADNVIHAYDTGLNKRAKECIQLSLDGIEIARYPSTSAASKATGCTRQGIGHVCNGVRNKHAGYLWRFVEN